MLWGVEAGLGYRSSPACPLLQDWLLSSPSTSTPQRSEWQLAASVHKPVGTGQAACLLFPGPSLVGWTHKYCVTQPKNSFPCLPPFVKGKPNPQLYALVAPSQALKYHFWGAALSRAGCSLQGNRSPSSPSYLSWRPTFSSPHPPPRGLVLSNTTLDILLTPGLSLENRVGLEASLDPVETGARLLDFLLNPGWCWCRCIAAKRTTKEVFCHCLCLVPSSLFALRS